MQGTLAVAQRDVQLMPSFLHMFCMQARDLIKQQIADDRKTRQSRGKPAASPQGSGVEGGGELGGGEGEGRKLGGGEGEGGKLEGGEGEGGKLEGGEGEKREGEGVKKSPSTTCRLQVRNVTYMLGVLCFFALIVVCLALLAAFFLLHISLTCIKVLPYTLMVMGYALCM